MAIIALDLGEKRVGLAISRGIIAQTLPTFVFGKKPFAEFLKHLEEIIKEQKIKKIVVGLPLGKEGKPTLQSKEVELRVKKIHRATNLPVKLVEESFSSLEAKRNIEKNNQNSRDKEKIDAEAARIILEQYLNET